ncbi:tetraspanin 5D isoform X1 [Ptiloglossa arizonensis]|uniref:tetraspanin 5D isoform X1 n=1 Tax=Ptiloglossa arizonensis TaxID=3350558 RepID=UPI003FA0BE0F
MGPHTKGVPLLRRAGLHGLVPNRRVANGGPCPGLLLREEGTILRSPRPGRSEQGALVQGRLRVRDTNVAGDQAPRCRDRGPGGRLSSAVRAGGEHDPVLHGQAQEVLPHVQELRHREHLEFPMDLRRNECLGSMGKRYSQRSRSPSPRTKEISIVPTGFRSAGLGTTREDRSRSDPSLGDSEPRFVAPIGKFLLDRRNEQAERNDRRARLERRANLEFRAIGPNWSRSYGLSSTRTRPRVANVELAQHSDHETEVTAVTEPISTVSYLFASDANVLS